MARAPRKDYPGAWHHVMHRGARSEPIFKQDEHCTLFLDTLGDTVQRAGVEVHAYSLMPNKFDLLVRSPNATLSRAMKHLMGVYTQRVNKLGGERGPVFRGRYKSELIEREAYLRYLFAYIHLTPVHAHLLTRPDEASGWTSYRAHLGHEAAMPWLSLDGARSWFGSAETMADWTRRLQVGSEPWPEDMELDADLPLQERKRIGRPRTSPSAPPKRARAAPPVDPLLARISKITGASLEELQSGKRGRGANAARRFAVEVLLAQGVGHRGVSDALDMTPRGVSNIAYRRKNTPVTPQIRAWLDQWEAGSQVESETMAK